MAQKRGKQTGQRDARPGAAALPVVAESAREAGNAAALLERYQETNYELSERIAELEFALEDTGWLRLAAEHDREFTREGLARIITLARIMYLKNPLINRGVSLQAMYVFGRGVSISAKDETVQGVVQGFLDDARNRAELTSHQARILKEVDLQNEGNLFFGLITEKTTGKVIVRTIPVDEIVEVISNPEDRREVWYYKRRFSTSAVDLETGTVTIVAAKEEYLPHWRYRPKLQRSTIGRCTVRWDLPVYHVKVGCTSEMTFGVPETYSALDWARAYKDFLSDWATIVRAFSRYAWRLTTKGGARTRALAREKLESSLALDGDRAERNPVPAAGATFIAGENTKLEPLRTSGATVKAEDGRRLVLMVCASLGLPETFFGDVSVGTLATANSLDRPTELKFTDRQELWKDIFRDLVGYTIGQSKKAARSALAAVAGVDESINVDFPPILEHSVEEQVTAILKAATLDGKTLAEAVEPKLVTRLILSALSVPDQDEVIKRMYPNEGDGEGPQGTAKNPVPPGLAPFAGVRPQPIVGTLPGQDGAGVAVTESVLRTLLDVKEALLTVMPDLVEPAA